MLELNALGKLSNTVKGKLDKLGNFEKKVNSVVEKVGSFVTGEKWGTINRSTLNQIMQRPDYLAAWNWDVEMPTIYSMGKSFTLSSAYVEATNVPLYNFDTRTIFRGGRLVKYTGSQMTINDLRMTFYADANNKSFSYLIAWMQNIYPGGGYWNMPKSSQGPKGAKVAQSLGYMQDINLMCKDMNNQDVIKLEYKDCFPISFEMTEYSSENARLQYFVTFAVNDLQLVGFNMATFSDQMMDLFNGTIQKTIDIAAGAVLDPIKAQAKSIGNAAWDKLKNSDVVSKATNFF